MNPPRLETCPTGSTIKMASTGSPYMSTVPIAPRAIANGTSRRGFFISPPAVLGSSKPWKLKKRTGAARTNTDHDGRNAPAPKPCTPCLTAYTRTVSVKPPRSTTRTHAPMIGIQRPTRNDSTAEPTAIQMKASENAYLPTPCRSMKNAENVETAVMLSVPPSQNGFVIQEKIEGTAPVRRPNASFVHTYGPPSSGNAEPSS